MGDKTYTYDEAMARSTEYFHGDSFVASVFVDKYALKDSYDNIYEISPVDMHKRLATEFARIDSDKYGLDFNERYEVYFSALDKFARIVPSGGVMSAVGNNFQYMSASNCVVVEPPKDSIGGIFDTAKALAQLYKRRAGVGTDLSTLRPEKAAVTNAAKTSSGAWSFADLYSSVTGMICQSGRRGALLLSLDVHHPDVLQFARMKSDRTKVTNANVSVRLSNEFLNAVEKNIEYEQRWPCDGKPKISKMVDARTVWKEIATRAAEDGDPGIMFWDNVCDYLPAHCYEQFRTVSSNPCGEINLSSYDSCRLISINLTAYVKNPFKDNASFDFKSFSEDVKIGMQMIDNLIDLELELIDRIKTICDEGFETEIWNKLQKSGELGRRTGLGTHGLADALVQLGIKYDSDEALNAVDKIYKALRDNAYQMSVDLAKVRGPFPIFDWEKEKNNKFIKRLPRKILKDMEKYGRRNISLLTQAPTGSVAIVSKLGGFDAYNISSGIEPIFQISYIRKRKVDATSDNIDHYDEQGNAWKKYKVFHSNAKCYLDMFGIKDDALPDYFVTSDNIDWKKRVEIQGVEQKYICHSISSCLSVGNHLVHTSDGLSYIEDIVGKRSEKGFYNLAESTNTINHENQQANISEGFYNGKSYCYQISFTGGRKIIGTPNHKLLILGNNLGTFRWAQLEDIKPGDFVVGRIGLGCFGNSQKHFSTTLGNFKSSISGGNTKKVKLPNRMSKKLARLLGYLTSDGSVSDNGIRLSQLRNNVVDDFINIIKDIFGIECYVCPDNRVEGLVSVQVNSRIVRDFVRYLGINGKAHEKTVPRSIFKCAGRQQTAEFIKGLTLDGFVSCKKLGIMTSSSKQLCAEIQIILDQFGIDSGIVKVNKEGTIREFPGGNKYATKDAWTVYCGMNESQKFIEKIGFAEDRKIDEATKKLRGPSRKSLVGHIPDLNVRNVFRKNILPSIKSNKLYEMFYSMTCYNKQGMDITRDTLLMLCDMGLDVSKYKSEIFDETFVFRKVVSSDFVWEKDTYDLSVEHGRSYVVNNFVSHNTINLPRNTKPQVIADIYWYAWKNNLKGITVYVEGTKDGVLVPDVDECGRPLKIIPSNAPKRPKELNCEIHYATIKGTKWAILIGLLHNYPYEMFMGKAEKFDIPNKFKEAKIVKIKKGVYNLLTNSNELLVGDIVKTSDNDDGAWTSRVMSMALRHGIPVDYLADQLSKDGSVVDINNVLARLLRRYIKVRDKSRQETCPQCGSPELIYSEGCKKCGGCGWTGCG